MSQSKLRFPCPLSSEYRRSQRTLSANRLSNMNQFMLRSPGQSDHSSSQCLICCEPTNSSSSLRLPTCSHIWCYACIFQRFSAAIDNETNYPVVCCNLQTPVQLSPAVDTIIGRHMTSLFLAKKTEYETQDKTYCHLPTCSTFINPTTIRNRLAKCKTCTTETCSDCKKPYHGTTTPCNNEAETGDEKFKAWCEDKKASRCPKCQRVVERMSGCNHIKCICRQEFCYNCGKGWRPRVCDCPMHPDLGFENTPEDVRAAYQLHVQQRQQLRQQRLVQARMATGEAAEIQPLDGLEGDNEVVLIPGRRQVFQRTPQPQIQQDQEARLRLAITYAEQLQADVRLQEERVARLEAQLRTMGDFEDPIREANGAIIDASAVYVGEITARELHAAGQRLHYAKNRHTAAVAQVERISRAEPRPRPAGSTPVAASSRPTRQQVANAQEEMLRYVNSGLQVTPQSPAPTALHAQQAEPPQVRAAQMEARLPQQQQQVRLQQQARFQQAAVGASLNHPGTATEPAPRIHRPASGLIPGVDLTRGYQRLAHPDRSNEACEDEYWRHMIEMGGSPDTVRRLRTNAAERGGDIHRGLQHVCPVALSRTSSGLSNNSSSDLQAEGDVKTTTQVPERTSSLGKAPSAVAQGTDTPMTGTTAPRLSGPDHLSRLPTQYQASSDRDVESFLRNFPGPESPPLSLKKKRKPIATSSQSSTQNRPDRQPQTPFPSHFTPTNKSDTDMTGTTTPPSPATSTATAPSSSIFYTEPPRHHAYPLFQEWMPRDNGTAQPERYHRATQLHTLRDRHDAVRPTIRPPPTLLPPIRTVAPLTLAPAPTSLSQGIQKVAATTTTIDGTTRLNHPYQPLGTTATTSTTASHQHQDTFEACRGHKHDLAPNPRQMQGHAKRNNEQAPCVMCTDEVGGRWQCLKCGCWVCRICRMGVSGGRD